MVGKTSFYAEETFHPTAPAFLILPSFSVRRVFSSAYDWVMPAAGAVAKMSPGERLLKGISRFVLSEGLGRATPVMKGCTSQ